MHTKKKTFRCRRCDGPKEKERMGGTNWLREEVGNTLNVNRTGKKSKQKSPERYRNANSKLVISKVDLSELGNH